MYGVDKYYNMMHKIERLHEFNDKVQAELNNKIDLLNTLYRIAFPDYVPEGKPRHSMPFTGDPVNDNKYEAKLVRKFKETYVKAVR